MSKRIIISLFLLLFLGISYAQEINPLLLKLHINDTTQRICDEWLLKHYKKGKLFNNAKNTRLYHIYYFTYRHEITKENFNNLSFIDSLKPAYLNQTNGKLRMLITYESYITNSNGKLIYHALCGGTGVNVERYTLRQDSLLINLIKNKGMALIYLQNENRTVVRLGGPYLGIIDNQIYGIKETKDGIEIYDKNKLMNYHWDDFFEDIFGIFKK